MSVVPLNHLYEYTDDEESCSEVALCGYKPEGATTAIGGWRSREQHREDCEDCFRIARRRWQDDDV